MITEMPYNPNSLDYAIIEKKIQVQITITFLL